MARRVNRHRRIRRHRNPFGANYRNLGEMSLAAIIAGVAARAIPEKVGALSSFNNGIIGYVLNFLSGSAVAGLLAKTWLRENGGIGGVVGTMAQVGGRIISDKFGKTVVTFSLPAGSQPGAAAVPSQMTGMSGFGDPAFNLGKYIKPYGFPLPNSGRVAAPVVASAGKALPSKAASKGVSRYAGVM